MITKFKIYELTEFEETNVIYSLGRSIKSFIDIYLGFVSTTNAKNSTVFWYFKKHIFTLQGIDYYHGDVDKYFEFELGEKTEDVDYKTYDMIMFINLIMNEYKNSQNLIPYSEIDNIIKDLYEEYEPFIQSKKYNL